MRRELAKQEGQRKRFRATFIRLGKKTNYQGYSEETILLNRVIDTETGNVVTDHLWFSFTKGFQDARIQEGDTIEFEARVKEYKKGYVNRAYGINNRKQDYKLSHPTRIAVVNNPPGQVTACSKRISEYKAIQHTPCLLQGFAKYLAEEKEELSACLRWVS